LTSLPTIESSDPRLREKLESLVTAIADTQGRLSEHLIALLEPERLVTLWQLKGILEKIRELLVRTLGQAVLTVNDATLDLVQSTEAILQDIESRLALFDSQVTDS
jgi:hypothetical protein